MSNPTPQANEIEAAAAAWAKVFTALGQDGPPALQRLTELTTEDVQFHDPFNDLRGRPALLALLQHTVEQVTHPRFEVLDTSVSGHTAYLKWCMTGRIRIIGDWQVTGMSELIFTPALRLQAHIDYWDAASQFYARLPLLGGVLRAIASRAGPPSK